MSTLRYAQYQAVEKPAFRGLVESSLMRTAYLVLQDKDAPNFEQRAGLSRLLFQADALPTVKAGYVRLFSWWAVNNPAIIQQYSDGGADPAVITDEAIDTAVLAFWDTASGVVETEGTEG